MKKDGLILTVLSVFLLLAGCSKPETLHREPADGVIRLRSGVRVTVGSKAAVGNEESFAAQVCGWEGVLPVALTETPLWENTQVFTAGTADVPFDLSPLRYYNKDGGIATTICGWYPQGKPDGGRVVFENPDGAVDVMLAPAVTGSLTAPVDRPLLFSHRAALLRFQILSDDWNTAEKITGITLRAVALPMGLDLVAGTLLTAPAADFALRNISPEGLIPPVQAADAGDVVMIAPTTGNVLYIDVQTTVKKYENIPVTTSDQFYAAGTAYTATLTFSGQGNGVITVGSSIGEWQPGISDGGIVD